MKLKFGAPKPPADASAQSPAATTPGGSGLKLSFKPKSAANTPVTETAPALPAPAGPATTSPTQTKKRKYTKKEKAGQGSSAAAGPAAPKQSKKRAREDEVGGAPSTTKKSKPSLSLKTSNAGAPLAPQRTHSISLKLKTGTPKTPSVPQRIKVKHVGQPPKRELGVGYDSEAEDAEVDPTIEHQFVLRMAPGPDCDYLHKAITEKRVGLSLKEGGADIHFRFFDKEGRRACVTIQGHHYAACMVDLPCIVEGMKSWEKKSGWYKTADICQMLLVHTKVDSEEKAKDAPLPREVDDKTWQYPHGLTPPMHYVRKRRFRKRVSTRTIEAVEEEVERLLALDEKAVEQGGSCNYELADLNRQDRDEASSQVGDEDAMGELVDAEGYADADADADGEIDADELARMMEMEFNDEDQPITSIEAPPGSGIIDAAHALAQHALADSGIPSSAIVGSPLVETPVGTPGASASAEPETEQDDEDDDDDDDDEDEIDEAAAAAQEMKAQLREEVTDLEREVENAKQQMERQNNPLLKQRLMAKFKSLQSDLELKKASLGDDDDE
ncbi:TAFII55 protein conserved region [Neofusicoccum parvum]|uniref:TAFII55 protein conserved region n=2 Tax=Neofusicoccum parvum TaxID=310453 RepID=A0ACB5RPI6_9PEZI|nr:putative transcription initiation factor tfiid subunit 7 protein [Neofusicoccum parvum UCRNP2]GME22423.1 TAFII55 protein conserved region [Neofusicoccum parvum]GME64689.1 TAFII55 protein conserved region [Neofusicoccum parvum]